MELKKEETKEKEAEEKPIMYSEVTKADSPVFQWVRKLAGFIFAVIFMGACLLQIYSLQQKGRELDQTMVQLEDQIQEEKEKQLQIKVDQEYYQSDQYKEQMARDRCKLIYPDEILIQIQE